MTQQNRAFDDAAVLRGGLAQEFTRLTNLVKTDLTDTFVRAYADLDERHHQYGGVVHGGVYCTIVEAVAGLGANYAVAKTDRSAVGVHNSTHFLRPFTTGRVLVEAQAVHQGRSYQLWEVVICAAATGKPLARGQLRAQNIPNG